MKTVSAEIREFGRGAVRTAGLCAIVLWAATAVSPSLTGAETPGAETEAKDAQTQELQITSDTVDMDFGKKNATFEGNVVVADERMRLTADKMVVWLDKEDDLKRIEATGNVAIEQLGTDRRARAGKAVYEVDLGTVVLTEDPVVIVGKSSATGAEKITYFRNTETFRFEKGRPTITVKRKARKGSQGPIPRLLGDGDDDSGRKADK